MRPFLFATLLFLFAAGSLAGAEAPPLYTLVSGGQEQIEVEKADNLTRLALVKGVPWQVVARENSIDKPYRLKAGMVLKIDSSHIVPAELGHGIVINLPELKLYHFLNGAYQRRYALAVGKRTWPTPTGDFYIRNKAKNPTWTVPVSIQAEMESAGRQVITSVPPGPKNPLGDYWMGTSAPGVGIHATNSPWSVGRSVSHGCMRMLPEQIAELFPQVEVGTPVKIIYQPIKMAVTPGGRIYLEAHPNIYHKKLDPHVWMETMAKSHKLQDRIDWEKVLQVLKAKEGIARDVTREPRKMDLLPTTTEVRPPAKRRPTSLQRKEAKL